MNRRKETRKGRKAKKLTKKTRSSNTPKINNVTQHKKSKLTLLPAWVHVRHDSHIQGSTFLDDLSFSCHFHYHFANQVLHLTTAPFLVTVIFFLLRVLSPSGMTLQFPLPSGLAAYFSMLPTVFRPNELIDEIHVPLLGISLLLWHLSVLSRYAAIGVCIDFAVLSLSLVVASAFPLSGYSLHIAAMGLVGGALQVIGHMFYEKSFPAFRFYEATVTTPYFLVLSICFWCGYCPALKQEIYERSGQWSCFPRRRF